MNAAAPYSAAVTIPIACITAAAAVALIACAVYALLAPENTGHRCEPDHVDQLGAWLRRHLPKLRARGAASARPDQAGTAPATPASGAVPMWAPLEDYLRDDGVIHIEPDGSISVRRRAPIAPALRDTAAEGILIGGGDWEYSEYAPLVRRWSPENTWSAQ